MTLQEEMVKFRAKNNISQKKLAELASVSLQTINSVENGLQKPSKLTEQKIRMVIQRRGGTEC